MFIYDVLIPHHRNRTNAPGLHGRRLALLYRTFQMLEKKFESGIGQLLAAEKIVLVFLIIRGVYSGLVDTGGVRTLSCFTSLMVWGYAHASLKILGKVHETCIEALMTMKQKNRDPWLRRFHRSCTPLKLHITKMVFCDRGLPMTLTAFIFNSIAGLLVAHLA